MAAGDTRFTPRPLAVCIEKSEGGTPGVLLDEPCDSVRAADHVAKPLGQKIVRITKRYL